MVNLVSAKNNNNGVKGLVDSNENTFPGGNLVAVVGGNGGAGLVFYQSEPFNITSSTIVLSPRNMTMNDRVGQYLAAELSKYKSIYSRARGWNLTRIKNDTLSLPVKPNGDIDYEFITNLEF